MRRETKELLTINDLDIISHESAQIIYLSACSTAEMKARNLVNESIHLASTFQLSGFQHVIGTLWGADNNAAVEVASKFYEGLLWNLAILSRDCNSIDVSALALKRH